MDEIEKAVKTLAELSEFQMSGVLSEDENEFVLTHDIAIPLAWLIENGFALATEAGNKNMLVIYDAFMENFGGNNE